jgi:hypothetical protein
MTVWHLAFRADSLTCTIAKALSQGGHEVCVWVVEPRYDPGVSAGIIRNLRDTPGVTFVGRDPSRLPAVIDRLIIQAHPRPLESTREGAWLARRARAMTLISAGDRSRPWGTAMKMQWIEVRQLWRQIGRVDRIVYKDGFHPHDLIGLFKPRSNLGFDVHSQFLHDAELFRMMHAQDWEAAGSRPILVNFLGCRDPDVRARILDAVRPLLHPGHGNLSAVLGKPAFWHEYTNASPVGLGPTEFVRILSRSDFTLCPRGYSLVTHRPIEALLRGSIPVLASSELDLYGIELKDNENCIGVPEGQWERSIRRIARISEDDLVRMRNNIRSMFDQQLSYDAVAKRLRIRIGVADPGREDRRLPTQQGSAPVS